MKRKGRLVRAVGFEDGKEVGSGVNQERARSDTANDTSHRFAKGAQVEDKATEEDAEGDVHEHRKKTDDDGDMPVLQAHVSELTDTATVLGSSRWDGEVLVDPLLRKNSHQGGGKTER